MSTISIRQTRDKALLADFFCTDSSLYAYHLGDLDPFFFVNTRWWVASKSLTHLAPIEATLLEYNAFSTPVLIGLAENDAQAELWRSILVTPPVRAHIHYRKKHEQLIAEAGQLEPLGTYYKMSWNPRHEQRDLEGDLEEIDLNEVTPLQPSDIHNIRALHQVASPGAYFDERLLETGMCYGIWRQQELVAFSACHVYSESYSVAALGAIATHPQHRGQGLGAKVTLRLLDKLKNHISCICLNVHCENIAALKIYQRLGFVTHCEYEEAMYCSSS